jgi:ubiquinone/menaquinone biosynthesis C-methylase UbiE
MKEQEIRKAVRQRYADAAKQIGGCGCGVSSPCCGGVGLPKDISKAIGYSEEDVVAVPEGANLGLGCGNPVALASLKKGEVVLDLGSGAGFDCFLASKKVGKKGKVIGVDMTPEMIDKARENANNGRYANVEFRLGEIENLPAADNSVDAIISNCVINLSLDKGRVFREAYRVLKPGGRLMVSDLVLLKGLPKGIKESIVSYVSCIAGALMRDAYLDAMKKAGLRGVRVVEQSAYPLELLVNDSTAREAIKELQLTDKKLQDIARSVVSMKVEAMKPKRQAK